MEPIFRDIEPIEPGIIPIMSPLPYVKPRGWTGRILPGIITQPFEDVTEPFVPMPIRPEIDPGLVMPVEPDIAVEKAVPGGLKLWHLLVGLGVLFLMKKR